MSKQNKFTKSVMQRLEQEEKKAQVVTKEKILVKENPAPEKKKDIKKEAEKPSLKLDEIISKTKAREAKNKTFYLDVEVIENLQKKAKNIKMTDSKLANEIFRAVLELD